MLDRGFLNSVCTDIMELKHRKLTYYRGGFDDYVNFNHYKLANFKIFRWVGFPDRGRRTTTSVFPLKDFSYYYPEIITDGMRELESLSRKENINV